MALERFDFLSAIASADSAVLSWPAATAERAASYPSRWLIEAANTLHENAGAGERLTYETITQDRDDKPWLTFVASREAGLRHLAGSDMKATDTSDYNLTHMIGLTPEQVEQHPAIAQDPRMVGAIHSSDARSGDLLSKWDGLVGPVSPQLENAGTAESPISPSALETLANCPYRYFLGRVLGISAPAEADEAELSNMDRGLLVHRILERFVEDGGATEEELLSIAEEEFDNTEAQGATGYHLLWEIERDKIRQALRQFLAAESAWLGGTPESSDAEVDFGGDAGTSEVSIELDGYGEVHFHGKIDRLDVLGEEVRVRDFKTGKPDYFREKRGGGEPDRSVGNGRALQLPVYLEAAQVMYPGQPVSASYCFPLHDRYVHDVGIYTEEDRESFRETLGLIMGMVRQGVFPATPEQSDGDEWGGNCNYCDFKQLCPARKRQIWERKGRADPRAVPFNQLGNKASMMDDDDDDG